MERVDKLFVRPDMEVVDSSGRKPQTASYTDQTEPDRRRVQGYRDVFYNGSQRCRNIYITGEAGVGKTTLCESLVHTWCKSHSEKVRSDSGDEQVLAEFTILFYIALRDSSDEYSIEKMIEKQLEIYDVSEVLENEVCLVILDGLDEWTPQEPQRGSRFISKGLPGRKLKGNFTVLTTTRPWKLEVLRLKGTEVDKQIHIAGFSDSSLDTLIDSVVSILNEKYTADKTSSAFAEVVEAHKLHELIQTPVILMQMLCLWHSGNSIGNSQSEIYSNIIDQQLEYAIQTKEIQRQHAGLLENDDILPKCLTDKNNCEAFGYLLIALSKLAFNSLCNETRESVLVFSHRQTEFLGLSKDCLETCLKIGLLTQHKVVGRVTEKLKSVSFIHKTFQEYFAALFLATRSTESEIMEMIKGALSSLDTVLEMAKLLVFLCGMRPQVTTPLFEHVMDVVSADSRIQKYRQFWFDVESESLKTTYRVQEVVLEVLKEIRKSGWKTPDVRLDDLVIKKGSFADFLTFNQNLKPESVRSIYLNSLTLKPQQIAIVENPHELYRIQSNSLVKLCVLDSSRRIHGEVLYIAVHQVSSQLTCLGLVGIDLVSLGERVETMLATPQLISLVLRDLVLTHQQIGSLMSGLSQLIEIKQLNLSNLRCNSHDKNDCRYTVDLTNMSSLEGLFMYELGVDDVLLDSKSLVECSVIALPTTAFLRILRDAKHLQKLICLGMYRPLDAGALADVLPCLISAKTLDIQTVNFGDCTVRLSPDMSGLELVTLSNVTISDAALREFVDSLPLNGVTVYLHLTVSSADGANTTPEYIRQSPRFEVTKDFKISSNTDIFMEFFTIGCSDGTQGD